VSGSVGNHFNASKPMWRYEGSLTDADMTHVPVTITNDRMKPSDLIAAINGLPSTSESRHILSVAVYCHGMDQNTADAFSTAFKNARAKGYIPVMPWQGYRRVYNARIVRAYVHDSNPFRFYGQYSNATDVPGIDPYYSDYDVDTCQPWVPCNSKTGSSVATAFMVSKYAAGQFGATNGASETVNTQSNPPAGSASTSAICEPVFGRVAGVNGSFVC